MARHVLDVVESGAERRHHLDGHIDGRRFLQPSLYCAWSHQKYVGLGVVDRQSHRGDRANAARHRCERPAMTPPTDGQPRRSRGQSVVEFALVLPVLLLIMLLARRLRAALLQLRRGQQRGTRGHLLRGHARRRHLVRPDGLPRLARPRRGARRRTCRARVARGALTVSDADLLHLRRPRRHSTATLPRDFAGGIGNQVTVSVNQPFTFLTPLISDVFGGSLTLTASATAPILNPLDVSILAAPVPASRHPPRRRRPPRRPTPDPDADPNPDAGAWRDTDADARPRPRPRPRRPSRRARCPTSTNASGTTSAG